MNKETNEYIMYQVVVNVKRVSKQGMGMVSGELGRSGKA